MERDTTLNNSPYQPLPNSSSPAAIYFCSLCDKPFLNESSRRRHLRYCGSRPRRRPRSCRACNASKIKCSFETPCSRCMKKGIECEYGGAGAVGRRSMPTASEAARPESTKNVSLAPWSTIYNSNVATTDYTSMDGTQLQLLSGNVHPSVDPNTQVFSPSESLNLDGLFAFEDYASGQLQHLSDASVDVPWNRKPPNWCTWSSGGVSLSVVTEDPMVEVDSNLLAILQRERPHAQHNANLVIQSLRSLPTMMLRRDVFPWFIHPHSHLLSKPPSDVLPEALSTCMSIAQMFASRTSETKPFLWCTIRAEYHRFIKEKPHMSIFELLAAVQACMIYLIMCIVDQSRESEEASLELLLALHDFYLAFKRMCVGFSSQSELSHPSLNWEDWIFAESQRRLSSLWFLIGCVICVKTGITCDPSLSYRDLPLPGLKSLWEATSQSAWELEYEASRDLQASGLETLGNLIDAQKSSYSPSNAHKLDKWNAGVDNLGSLLNLVGTMV